MRLKEKIVFCEDVIPRKAAVGSHRDIHIQVPHLITEDEEGLEQNLLGRLDLDPSDVVEACIPNPYHYTFEPGDPAVKYHALEVLESFGVESNLATAVLQTIREDDFFVSIGMVEQHPFMLKHPSRGRPSEGPHQIIIFE
jgi:hypothetical protein